MKITKILTIATLAFAAHGVQAQVSHDNHKSVQKNVVSQPNSQATNLSMEMPLESYKEPFSYNIKSEVDNDMEMPLESSKKPFSYSKDEVKSNIISISEKLRDNKILDKKSLKL